SSVRAALDFLMYALSRASNVRWAVGDIFLSYSQAPSAGYEAEARYAEASGWSLNERSRKAWGLAAIAPPMSLRFRLATRPDQPHAPGACRPWRPLRGPDPRRIRPWRIRLPASHCAFSR